MIKNLLNETKLKNLEEKTDHLQDIIKPLSNENNQLKNHILATNSYLDVFFN